MVFGTIGIAVLVAMMLLTVVDVFLRFTFNRPIVGSTEVTQFMMVSLAFLVLVLCTIRKAHVKVDLVAAHFPLRVQTVCDAVLYLFGSGMFSLIAWRTFLQARNALFRNQASDVLSIPVSPFYFLVAVTCGMVSLLLLTHLVKNIVQSVKR